MSDNLMYDVAVRQIDRLESEVERLRALNAEMARALEKIIATPSMPFPDPGAHSWRAWGSAVYSAWGQIQSIARAALSKHRQER